MPGAILHHDRRAGDGRSDRCRVNRRSAQSLRHLQKHRSFLQRHVPGSGFETEECLRADAGQRVILKEQLRSGSRACLESEIIFDDIAQHGGMSALCRVDHADPVDDLSNFGRCEWAGDGLVS